MVEHTGSSRGSIALTCGNYRNETGIYSNLRGENTTGVRAAAAETGHGITAVAPGGWLQCKDKSGPKVHPGIPRDQRETGAPGARPAPAVLWIENTGRETLEHDVTFSSCRTCQCGARRRQALASVTPPKIKLS